MEQRIPKNYAEMHRLYERYIWKVCNKTERLLDEQEDFYGHVWMMLIQSKFLEKFLESEMTPQLLKLTEVLSVLGITYKQWLWALDSYGSKHAWVLPSPLRGSGRTDLEGVYRVTDISPLIDEGPWAHRGVRAVPEKQEVSVQYFRNYLCRAIKNIFSNWLRQKERRHKERVYDYFPQLSVSHFRRQPDGDNVHWTDLPSIFHAGRETASRLDDKVLVQGAVQRFYQVVGSEEKGDAFFDAIENGATMKEALSSLDVSLQIKMRVSKLLGGLSNRRMVAGSSSWTRTDTPTCTSR